MNRGDVLANNKIIDVYVQPLYDLVGMEITVTWASGVAGDTIAQVLLPRVITATAQDAAKDNCK